MAASSLFPALSGVPELDVQHLKGLIVCHLCGGIPNNHHLFDLEHQACETIILDRARDVGKHGVAAIRSLPCVRLHSSEHASSPPYSVDEEAANFDYETKESVICINDDEAAANDYEDITKKLAKGKYQAFSEGSTTDSSEDEYSTDDDQELKQAMLQSIFYDLEVEDWIRFRSPGATFHMGETSGVSTISELSELEMLEMIHF